MECYSKTNAATAPYRPTNQTPQVQGGAPGPPDALQRAWGRRRTAGGQRMASSLGRGDRRFGGESNK